MRWRRTRSEGGPARLADAELSSGGSGSALAAPTLSPGALVFLRGRDADARLRELAAYRTAARPIVGALAMPLVARRLYEELGYRSLGDYARERLGIGARTVREWARVWRALEGLPLLRSAFLTGEVGFSVLRRVVALATPDSEAACLASVRGRTLRSVEAMVRAVKAAEASDARAPGPGATCAATPENEDEQDRVPVRLACNAREAGLWYAAMELARRTAGESLPVWRCAELVAAEAASILGAADAEVGSRVGAPEQVSSSISGLSSLREKPAEGAGSGEHGLSAEAFSKLPWASVHAADHDALAGLALGLGDATAREIDRRLRAAIAFLQSVDLEMGRVLRQMVDRRLFDELGFEGLARYAQERLDISERTARRIVSLARAEQRAPAVATAFRHGRIQGFQASAIARVATPATAEPWVERAQRWTFRRLEVEIEAAWLQAAESKYVSMPGEGAARPVRIEFRAPREVATFFLAMLDRAGSLEKLLALAIASWVEAGSTFADYADFERDGFRCTAPGCTSRRNLQAHHVEFRSAGGADEPGNRTTLCAFHHLRGVHGGALRIRGRAPHALVFELGMNPPERFRSGDLRLGGPSE